jgi:hypothetical protein
VTTAVKAHTCKCGAELFAGETGWVCRSCDARILPYRGDRPKASDPKATLHESGIDTECKTCRGKGKIACDECLGTGECECPHCGQDMDCDECDGEGFVECNDCC